MPQPRAPQEPEANPAPGDHGNHEGPAPGRTAYLLAALVLAVGWGVCGLIVVSLLQTQNKADSAGLMKIISNTEARIGEQLSDYTHALDAAAIYFGAFGRTSRAQWREYARAMELSTRYPGIKGIGVVLPVSDAGMAAFVDSVRSDGAPDFTIHPLPGCRLSGSEHGIVTYIEPEEVNHMNLGLDEFSETNRRETALAVRDLGRPRLTRRVALVQDAQVGSSCLLYVPVYRSGAPVATVEERRSAFVAWTFTPIVFSDILPAALDEREMKLHLWFYEGPEATPDALLYASDALSPPGHFEFTTHLDLGGQIYTLGWRRGPAFISTPLAPQIWAVAIGALATLLLASLIYSLINRRAALERVVEWRTAQLRQSEQRFRTYVDQASDALFVVDSSGRIIDANRRTCASLGYGRSELLRMEVFDLDEKPEVARAQPIWRQITPGSSMTLLGMLRRKDGTCFPVEVQYSSFDLNGIRYYMGLARDITERRRAERALRESEARLRQAQKMEAVGQLAGGVAHDFNNILTAFSLNIALLSEAQDLSPETRANLQELEREVARAAALVRQLLFFSRRQAVNIAPIDLNSLVANLLKMLRRLLGEHIEIEWHGKEGLPLIDADAGMIDQIVMNLCVNARDAMPDGGRLILRTASETVDAAAPNPDARAGAFVRLSVTDTGCGIDEETRKHLFEPFFTTKEQGKGTGLGLATVYGIVKQHHGWIEVESEPGRGSTFHILLPARAGGTAAGGRPQAAEAARGRGEMILVVEDEDAIRLVMAVTLKRFGYKVIEAGSGPYALERWRAHHPEISLIISDMVMPGGLDGFDLLRQMREQKPSLRAILISGYNRKEPPPAIADVTFLAKPFNSPALLRAVRECLDRPSP